jgi:hypothetical protein
MPYIKRERRAALPSSLSPEALAKECQCAGEINYCIIRYMHAKSDHLIYAFLEASWNLQRNYQRANDLCGALLLAGCELTRRRPERRFDIDKILRWFTTYHLGPYEDSKIAENGDVEIFDVRAREG